MNLLASFESAKYAGSIDLSYRGMPLGLTRIRGQQSSVACRKMMLPTLRIFVGFQSRYPCFDGMAIDTTDVPTLETEMKAMDERRHAKHQHGQQRQCLLANQAISIQTYLESDEHARVQMVQQATADKGLVEHLDPALSARIDLFVSGQALLDMFRSLNAGPQKATKASLRALFPSHERPPVCTKRADMLVRYIVSQKPTKFDISDEECRSSVRRAVLASSLGELSTRQGWPKLTPADMESSAWCNPAFVTVKGLPFIVRTHVYSYACCSRPWKPVFVADRLDRNTWITTMAATQKQSSVFVEKCTNTFINTLSCWYRRDTFRNLPRAILEFICSFLCQTDDVLHMIMASRAFATAAVHWFRRPNTTPECGALAAQECDRERCGNCCRDLRHRRKRSRRF